MAEASGLVSTTFLTAASSPSRSDWRLSPDEGVVTSGAFDEDAGLSGAGDGDGAVVSGASDEGAVTSVVASLSSDIQVLPIRSPGPGPSLCAFCPVVV